MNTRLNHIQNWPELAEEANWSGTTLARNCGISLRTLQRHFLKTMGKTPKTWLDEQRHLQAVKLLREGSSIKETAAHLGYKHAHHFSRNFKKYFGFPPTEAGHPALVPAPVSEFGKRPFLV
jgi:AraC-like DNA-binding protein